MLIARLKSKSRQTTADLMKHDFAEALAEALPDP